MTSAAINVRYEMVKKEEISSLSNGNAAAIINPSLSDPPKSQKPEKINKEQKDKNGSKSKRKSK